MHTAERSSNPEKHPLSRGAAPSPAFEALEERVLLSAAYPSVYEQYLLELVNRARSDPGVEAGRFGIDLNEGLAPGTISEASKQPLAPNVYLMNSAQGHSLWMLDNGIFDHVGVGGTQPIDRMAIAGYNFIGWWGWGENIAWYGEYPGSIDPIAAANQVHENLFVDSTDPTRGHRDNILNGDFKELGTGIRFGIYSGYNTEMVTEEFAYAETSSFLTGVAYDDSLVSNDDFYTPGEGLSGLTITAARQSDSAVFNTTTWTFGGYVLPLPPGTYDVTGSGGGLGGPVVHDDVVIGSQNVKLDFTPDLVATGPDLSITDVSYVPGLRYHRGALPTTIRMLNGGTNAGAFHVELRLSTDTTWGNADDVVVRTQQIPGGLFGVGVVLGEQGTVIPMGAAEGHYYVGVKIDAANAVSESSELNNIWWSSGPDIWVVDMGRFFNEGQYLAMYADVKGAVDGGHFASGYDHFVQFGMGERRDPSAFFDEGYYRRRYADVAGAVTGGILRSGFEHYVLYGATEGREPSPFFSERYYRGRYSDVAAAVSAGIFKSGLEHFMLQGVGQGRYTTFSEQQYLEKYSDVANAVAGKVLGSGLQHYLLYGAGENRDPCPLFRQDYYLAVNIDAELAVNSGEAQSGLEHFILAGQFDGLWATFDEEGYLSLYSDVANAVSTGKLASGLEHFLKYGLGEGRDPCPYFVETNYLGAYPDVQNAVDTGVFDSGLEHYLRFGQFEGRSPNP